MNNRLENQLKILTVNLEKALDNKRNNNKPKIDTKLKGLYSINE